MDALAIACATRDHVNLLNNQHAKSENSRYDLQNKLRNMEKWTDKGGIIRDKFTDFKKPWANFTADAKDELGNIIVSFKQNLRVINKATNYYTKWGEENGQKIKEKVEQMGQNWAIRKPLHKDTVYSKVELPRIKVAKGKILTATRKTVNTTFGIDMIESITDTGIQKILKNYLESKGGNPEIAFTPEGLDEMNNNIKFYNDNKDHKPIYKVRIFKETAEQFPLGQTGNKKDKYVTTAKGTNLFYAIYEDKNSNRSFMAIPLNEIIERQKQGLQSVPDKNEKGESLCTLCPYLTPNDLVYVPTEEDKENGNKIDFKNLTKKQLNRLYNVNDFSATCYFTPNSIAKAIAPKEVDLAFDEKKNKITGSYDTKTASLDGVQIKDVCIKIKVDRLGNISLFQPPKL